VETFLSILDFRGKKRMDFGQEADGFCSGRTIAVMDQAMDVSERFTG
jgi:hypothetical protein